MTNVQPDGLHWSIVASGENTVNPDSILIVDDEPGIPDAIHRESTGMDAGLARPWKGPA